METKSEIDITLDTRDIETPGFEPITSKKMTVTPWRKSPARRPTLFKVNLKVAIVHYLRFSISLHFKPENNAFGN